MRYTTLDVTAILPGEAQQGGVAIGLPDVGNYAGLAIGAAPEYQGFDEYTVGVGPAVPMSV